MKPFILMVCLLGSLLHAEVQQRYLDQALLASDIKIVDIRTPAEWKETGLVKGSIPIMFFDPNGNYDVPSFLNALSAKVDVKKPFALICRSGNRTRMVADFLSQKYGYTVIDLQGGIKQAITARIPLVPYTGGQ